MSSRFIILFILIAFQAQSQTREITWIRAELELMNGNKVQGLANYNLRGQVVQLRIGNATQTYREEQIKQMVLTKDGIRRDFRLVAYKDESDRVQLMMAELVYQSPEHYSFFRRFEAETERTLYYGDGINRPAGQSTYRLDPDFNKDSFIFERKGWSRQTVKRFLINYEGDIVNASRKWFYRTHADKKKEVKKFVDDNVLNFTKDEHLVQILKYYESLKP